MSLTAKVHAMQLGEKYPDTIDLFHRRKDNGQLCLSGNVHIDILSDLGLDEKSMKELQSGREVELEIHKIDRQDAS